jgi:hypothetical protein
MSQNIFQFVLSVFATQILNYSKRFADVTEHFCDCQKSPSCRYVVTQVNNQNGDVQKSKIPKHERRRRRFGAQPVI